MRILLVILTCYFVYSVGVQYERGGVWRLLAPIAMIALLMSWVINQTLGRVIYGKPTVWRETFSKHTERMQSEPNWRGRLARLVAALLNVVAFREDHIKRLP